VAVDLVLLADGTAVDVILDECGKYFTLPHTIRADPSKFGCIPSGIW